MKMAKIRMSYVCAEKSYLLLKFYIIMKKNIKIQKIRFIFFLCEKIVRRQTWKSQDKQNFEKSVVSLNERLA